MTNIQSYKLGSFQVRITREINPNANIKWKWNKTKKHFNTKWNDFLESQLWEIKSNIFAIISNYSMKMTLNKKSWIMFVSFFTHYEQVKTIRSENIMWKYLEINLKCQNIKWKCLWRFAGKYLDYPSSIFLAVMIFHIKPKIHLLKFKAKSEGAAVGSV